MGKIFVLEDDQDIREVVKLMLESENYVVESFANVHDFMNRDAKDIPDLFILDVMLPDGSGIDVCAKLKSESMLTKSPVIIMSAHASVDEVARGCSAEGFIAKPFDMENFLDKVRTQIDNSASE
ncbi:response regulator transcription factor [Pedobacter aquatilis]|uniref:response regulator transcription factor n=1 Tax=Pedobacter aquatilis TaxID=351343 RepID=UPI002931E7D5|nr:response regulator transcription factor [Pedobacter aquatilis]